MAVPSVTSECAWKVKACAVKGLDLPQPPSFLNCFSPTVIAPYGAKQFMSFLQQGAAVKAERVDGGIQVVCGKASYLFFYWRLGKSSRDPPDGYRGL